MASTNTPARSQAQPPAHPQAQVAELIKRNHKAIESVLPKHLDSKRMARIALVEARRNPALLQADPVSFAGALLQAAELGLEPGVAGMGYLVTFNNRKKGTVEVQFIPGYRGLMDLARRSGQVGVITADVVREGDTFDYQMGTNPYLTHKPGPNRGEVTHVYATAHLLCGDWQFEVLTKGDVEEIRKGSKAGTFGPWKDNWEEMAKKSSIRKLCKYLPVSVEVQRAIALDEMADAGIAQSNSAVLPEDFDMQIEVPEETTEE